MNYDYLDFQLAAAPVRMIKNKSIMSPQGMVI